jgi:hypothetical protein
MLPGVRDRTKISGPRRSPSPPDPLTIGLLIAIAGLSAESVSAAASAHMGLPDCGPRGGEGVAENSVLAPPTWAEGADHDRCTIGPWAPGPQHEPRGGPESESLGWRVGRANPRRGAFRAAAEWCTGRRISPPDLADAESAASVAGTLNRLLAPVGLVYCDGGADVEPWCALRMQEAPEPPGVRPQ